MTNWTNQPEPDGLVTPGEAAERLYVTTRTLQRMADRGEIEAIKLPSGHRRYLLASIEAIRDGKTPKVGVAS